MLQSLFRDCQSSWSADFTASAVLQGICGNTLQLHALRLAYAANLALARLRDCFWNSLLSYHL